MKILGRILARKGKTVGVFIPFQTDALENGIWELREILGEIQIVRIGKPALPDARYQALQPNDMVNSPFATMTKKEIDQTLLADSR